MRMALARGRSAPLLSAGGGKVAPGMECTFKVHFAPKDAKDYYCELVCLTEREKFLVSVSVRARARARAYFGALLRRAIPAQFVPVRY